MNDEKCKEFCGEQMSECAYRQGKSLQHFIRSGSVKKDNWKIDATNFERCGLVRVYTPKKPTPQEVDKTLDFLLSELDDHDAYTRYMRLLKRSRIPIPDVRMPTDEELKEFMKEVRK